MDELWALIRSIPEGQVCSYGTIGAHLSPPTSGRAVGRWMAHAPEDVPWWRVVARSGLLPIGKRGLEFEEMQAEMLSKEGVVVVSGKVDMREFGCWDL